MIGVGKNLEKEYPLECAKLIQLCGLDATGPLPQYLNRTYAITEKKWEENVQRLMKYNVRIKYLMFGEAAPRTLEGEVNYFYNNFHSNWSAAIVEGLVLSQQVTDGVEQKLNEVAQANFCWWIQCHFRLIITIPIIIGIKSLIRNWSIFVLLAI